ncbi:hypothetical protein EZV62_020675 [Acer yangbiense]|uniref:Uncharacterized protein n=1 Tax=Acer yangbiense TaxID=1000413 RepID=A0A5C7HF11_9ROSI|nr:hypothetical protein EZV62_020675 [Acer yangbiense]
MASASKKTTLSSSCCSSPAIDSSTNLPRKAGPVTLVQDWSLPSTDQPPPPPPKTLIQPVDSVSSISSNPSSKATPPLHPMHKQKLHQISFQDWCEGEMAMQLRGSCRRVRQYRQEP